MTEGTDFSTLLIQTKQYMLEIIALKIVPVHS